MDWKAGLSSDQIGAANHIGRHARLLAGPGTGKTRTLTRRILALVIEHNINPEEILALTFTRVAAYQLREEVFRILEPLNKGFPRISTLHAFALRQLLINSAKVTVLPQPLRIADDWEERYIIMENIKTDLGSHLDSILKDHNRPLKKTQILFHQLSSDWETLSIDRSIDNRLCRDARFIGAWQNHRNRFGYILRSELVYQLKNSLQNIPNFHLESNFRHLLVDEYQDLNSCDLAVIEELERQGVELYVAGDDDQSIYGFRFANPNGIRIFPDRFGAEKLNLEICFRCDKKIIEFGEFVANLDYNREPKITKARENASDGEVLLLRFEDQFAEAEWIASKCHDLLDNNPEGSILILLRSDYKGFLSEPLMSECERRCVPITKESTFSPFDMNEGRKVLSLIRLLNNQFDDLSWYTLLSLTYGIGSLAMGNIRRFAETRNCRFSEAVSSIKNDEKSTFPILVRQTIRDTFAFINKTASIDCPSIEKIVAAVDHGSPNTDNQTLLKNYFLRVSKETGSDSMSVILDAFSTSIENAEQQLVVGKVNLMTMHRAKGLSADNVFIIGAEDEYIPGSNDEGEERRLLYVSLTRARHRLYITICKNRRRQQRYTGSRKGKVLRHLCRFIEHSPIKPVDII